jgi:hypothetical protein
MTLKTVQNQNNTKSTYQAYPFGTQVKFGNDLQGEIIDVSFRGPAAQPVYLVEWWEIETGLNKAELYEEQLRVVR